MTDKSIVWEDGVLRLLDQRQLPGAVEYLGMHSAEEVATAIRTMVVRGAPAIGAAAAYGLAVEAKRLLEAGVAPSIHARMEEAAEQLRASRPTAVNLEWAVNRVMGQLSTLESDDAGTLFEAARKEAEAIAEEDVCINRSIGMNALQLLPEKITFIHHCNTGSLATVDYGTALGIIRAAHEAGREVFVYVDETRPRLQGARLTAWELTQLGIPYQVIVDSASGFVMARHQVDAVVVGCDRVAANGDTANKIGTYNLALAAAAHEVPFYVAAPTSTIDFSLHSGEVIPIEERSPAEVTSFGGVNVTVASADAYNPAFDVTPAALISGIITEFGVARPPYDRSLQELMKQTQLAQHA